MHLQVRGAPRRDTRVVSQLLLFSLNAPTGAWCSLTTWNSEILFCLSPVSMHLQVRGAP